MIAETVETPSYSISVNSEFDLSNECDLGSYTGDRPLLFKS